MQKTKYYTVIGKDRKVKVLPVDLEKEHILPCMYTLISNVSSLSNNWGKKEETKQTNKKENKHFLMRE